MTDPIVKSSDPIHSAVSGIVNAPPPKGKASITDTIKQNLGMNDQEAASLVQKFTDTTSNLIHKNPALADDPRKLATQVVDEMAKDRPLMEKIVAKAYEQAPVWKRLAVNETTVKSTLSGKIGKVFEDNQAQLESAVKKYAETAGQKNKPINSASNEYSVPAGAFEDPAAPLPTPAGARGPKTVQVS